MSDQQAEPPPMVLPVPEFRVGPRSDGGPAFWVDPERAQHAIDELRAVALDVRDMQDLLIHAYIEAPAADEVSRNVAVQANRMADNAKRYVEAWMNQLASAANRLEEQLLAYQRAEADNAARLRDVRS